MPERSAGFSVTDGYQLYHSIADEREDLTISGCWSHARRGFADVAKPPERRLWNIRTVAYTKPSAYTDYKPM
ncbi:MAG: IS66 family transposase [Enterocloster sp.]